MFERKIIIAALALASGIGAMNQDARAQTPAPPRVMVRTQVNERAPQLIFAGEQKLVPTTYLGVGAQEADEALAVQLGLPLGIGLTVVNVIPESPAAKAGLQQHDVLHKLNDQLLINGPQLATLIRTFKEGDVVKLAVIRAGKPQTIEVTLGKRELPPLSVRIRAEVGQPFMQGSDVLVPMPPIEGNFPVGPRIIRIDPAGRQSTISRRDDTHAIVISDIAGQRTLFVQEIATGKVVYDGAFDPEAIAEKLPADVLQKVEGLEASQPPIPEVPAPPTTIPSSATPRLAPKQSV